MRKGVWSCVIAGILGTGCEQATTVRPDLQKEVIPQERVQPLEPAAEVEKQDKEPVVEFDEAPSINFVSNRYLLHQYKNGLVLPFAHEGIKKYSHEYSRPLGDAQELDGRVGRVLKRSAVKLNVPWRPTDNQKTSTVRFYLHGVASGQRLQLNINGKRVGVAEVPRAWSHVDVTIPVGVLKPGENEFVITMKAAGQVGRARSYGLFHAAHLISGEAPEATWFDFDVDGQVLKNFDRWSMYVEVPQTSWFVASVSGDSTITIRSEDGEVVHELEPNARGEVRLSLHQWSGKLVELSLKGNVQWTNPHIALEKVAQKARPEPVKNTILLVVDALRSDRLKLYANTRVETPRFTDAAKQGVVFRNNQAASPSSPPSHSSIQTGMIPRVHGVAGDKGKLNAGTPLISSQLVEAGIATAYVGNNSFGMGRLREAGKWTAFHQPVSEGKGIDCRAVNQQTFQFIDAQVANNKRFFVSMLPFEPHAPYRFHEGISEKYHEGSWGPPVGKFADGYLLVDIMAGRKQMNVNAWSQLKALYDGEVEHMDRCFGELVDGLKERNLWDETAIIVTSDHGEGMNERGRLGHAYGHYSELADVPFILYAPKWIAEGPQKIDAPTSVVDIAPTILELMGVEPSPKIQGKSVLPMILRDGPWVPQVVSSEYGRSYALRAKDWRLIVNYDGSDEVYNLAVDPSEASNLVKEDVLGVRYLRDISGFFLDHRSDWKATSWGTYNNHGSGFLNAVK